MVPGLAAGNVLGKVRSIGVDVQNHVAHVENDDGIFLGGGVVKELFDALHGFLRCGILLCCNGAESGEHGAVDGSGLEMEDACDLHDEFIVAFQKEGE